MDDVDAAESLGAKNMLLSGDWVTQHLNGTVYLDKAPLKYWITAGLYSVFGVHNWVARLPTALAALILCWLVVRMGRRSDTPAAGFYSGLVAATSIGLFLFTRTVIPDVILTLFISLSLWCFLQALESKRPSLPWAMGIFGALGCAVLTKGLIGFVFPVAIAFVYLKMIGKLTARETWRRLHVLPGGLLFLAIAAPWHVMATLRNPPIFDLTLFPGPHFGGQYRGFFWFYFINEQLLRFLNQRWPHDYNTVPRLWFWLYHLIWFFPWILFAPAVCTLRFNPAERAGRLRLLAVCWIAVVMLFFTFSTTQEYYSMPIYPAIALLLGSAMAADSRWLNLGLKLGGAISLAAALTALSILFKVRTLAAPGDIYRALAQHPNLYTLSLGHMADLTLPAFAYLKLPLLIAGMSLFFGGLAMLITRGHSAYIATALMLAGFFQAALLALIVFEPYLSSYAIAEKLNRLPAGNLIICGKYNPLSSIFFYFRDRASQNDADLDILEYGSLAPNAPQLVVDDAELKRLWTGKQQIYIVAKQTKMGHVRDVLGSSLTSPILQSGDKYLFGNLPAQ